MTPQSTPYTLLVCLLILILGGTGCRENTTTETPIDFPRALTQAEDERAGVDLPTGSTLAGSVIVDGSSTVMPVSTVMAEAFQNIYPQVQVAVGVSGTGGGFKKFCAGDTDMTGASRPINAREVELCKNHQIDYIELPMAFDSLSVVHRHNSFLDCLTVDELRKMWEPAAQGKVTQWQHIRATFPAQPLVLFGPGTDSGTFDYFTLAIVGAEGSSRSDYTSSEDDTVLVQGVATDPNALGYFGYAYYLANRDKLKLVAINSGYGCVYPSAQTVTDTSYQPLSRPIFIYVKQASATRPEVQAFTHFYLAPENADLILKVGYVPLPNITLLAAASRFDKGMTGSAFGGSGSIVGVSQKGLQEREP